MPTWSQGADEDVLPEGQYDDTVAQFQEDLLHVLGLQLFILVLPGERCMRFSPSGKGLYCVTPMTGFGEWWRSARVHEVSTDAISEASCADVDLHRNGYGVHRRAEKLKRTTYLGHLIVVLSHDAISSLLRIVSEVMQSVVAEEYRDVKRPLRRECRYHLCSHPKVDGKEEEPGRLSVSVGFREWPECT